MILEHAYYSHIFSRQKADQEISQVIQRCIGNIGKWPKDDPPSTVVPLPCANVKKYEASRFVNTKLLSLAASSVCCGDSNRILTMHSERVLDTSYDMKEDTILCNLEEDEAPVSVRSKSCQVRI
ncbi:hypothetical protein NPIL_128261 [Nephila pilipes]|uniref:Uncharacterized protein n=1 Tax=Nephila pilipes TaxID=299642 RepID=A0A8X6UFK9_NEPPI|nr:hypothetical protein NPIL_128261 [Nephila pilipes]